MDVWTEDERRDARRHPFTVVAKCCRLFLAVLLALVVVGTSLAVVVATLGLTLCAFLAVLSLCLSILLAAVLLGSSLLGALVLTSSSLSTFMLTSSSLSALVLTSSLFLAAVLLLGCLLLAALFLITLYIALLCVHLSGEAHHSHHHDGTQNHFLHCLLVFLNTIFYFDGAKIRSFLGNEEIKVVKYGKDIINIWFFTRFFVTLPKISY